MICWTYTTSPTSEVQRSVSCSNIYIRKHAYTTHAQHYAHLHINRVPLGRGEGQNNRGAGGEWGGEGVCMIAHLLVGSGSMLAHKT